MSDGDARRGDRFPVLLRIRLKYGDEQHFIERFSVNLSRGGAFIATRAPRPPGTALRFEFQLEGGATVIRGLGSVVWVRPFDAEHPERPHGMGIRFEQLDEQSRALLDRALAWRERQRESAVPPVERPAEGARAALLADADARLAALFAECGLRDEQLVEATARARSHAAPLVDKLAGDPGALDFLLEPPRPEPLSDPPESRLLDERG